MSHQPNTSLSLKSPRVIVAGVLFLAALLSSFAFAALSDRSSAYWVVSHPVAAGSLLTSADLELIDASLVGNQDQYMAQDLSPIGSTTTATSRQVNLLQSVRLLKISRILMRSKFPSISQHQIYLQLSK
jgi:hypothetical protein